MPFLLASAKSRRPRKPPEILSWPAAADVKRHTAAERAEKRPIMPAQIYALHVVNIAARIDGLLSLRWEVLD